MRRDALLLGRAAVLSTLLFSSSSRAADAGKIILEESASDESAGDLPAYKIVTPQATYFLEKSGAGLSSMLDKDGNDWLGFHPKPGSGSGGEYRGFPNAVHAYFHPRNDGTEASKTKIEYVGNDRITITAESGNGLWACRYDFFPTHCTFTMTRAPADDKYWVLYEGTPGGSYEDSDWWMTSAADKKTVMTTPHEGDIPAPEWIAFGDPRQKRAIALLHHTDDEFPDKFYEMRKEMTVFGFGRRGLERYLSKTPEQVSIGFVESDSHAAIGQAVEAWQVATAAAIRVSQRTLFGEIDCFEIATPTATYLYGRKGAGFASILDKDGRDWISYRPGGKARGEYRGLPKCGQPTKFFHCGYGYGQYKTENTFVSEIAAQAPEHVRIASQTVDRKTACTWDFYPTHATFTLLRIDLPSFWFLYEGTPGGRLDSSGDFVIRPDGRKTSLDQPWSQNVPWVCFGASETPIGLFCVNHQLPEPGETDSYVSWPFETEKDGSFHDMTVFGFGRKGYKELVQHIPDLKVLPARFSIGFVDRAEPAAAQAACESILTFASP